MKKTPLVLALVTLTSLAASPAFASKTYQVTGPVVAMSADTVTVQKGKETWEIGKGVAALPSAIKIGDKVTIEYLMTATKVTDRNQPAAAEKKAKK